MHTTSSNPLIQLHYASLELLDDKHFWAHIFSWLSLQEQTRYGRFVSKQQASQFLLARALLRSQLTKQVPTVQPHEWVFVMDEQGKPMLGDEFSYLDIHFNLSHSEGLVVLALAVGYVEKLELGVDIECIHRSVFSLALSKRYFSECECADLIKLNGKQQSQRITQLWTLKESYLKASGLGITVPLNKVRFGFEKDSDLNINLSLPCPSPLFVAQHCSIGLFSLGQDYSLALTIINYCSVNLSSVTINEWTELNDKYLGLPYTLLRKTKV
jgi:4'-phosphopantetheinyl transferase